MYLKLDTGIKVKTIGDPHLGKKFVVGVPPDRIGEREASQINQLVMELMDTGCDINIMMGDLFDKFNVDATTVMAVYEVYAYAATNNPNIDYILLRGNHDVSRETTKFSSFDLLAKMLAGFSNIIIINDYGVYTAKDKITNLLLFGYDAFKSSAQMLEERGCIVDYAEAAFGHWDIETFGNEANYHNLIPYKLLSEITPTIVTGHVHTAEKFFYDPQGDMRVPKELIAKYSDIVEVIVTGSMQPYAHGQDPNELIYVTRTLEEYEKDDPSIYHNKCLRLILGASESIPTNLDCMQFSFKIVSSEDGNELEDLENCMTSFDMKSLFFKCLQAYDVDKDYQEQMWETYKELSSDAE